MEITNAEFEEYQILKRNAEHQAKLNSVKSLASLKDDIDTPIRKLVAMLALLGCEPKFSCCGFNYDGQPLHKTHQYGIAYVQMKETPVTINFIDELKHRELIYEWSDTGVHWHTTVQRETVFIELPFHRYFEQIKHTWTERSCIHYPEWAILRISWLEKNILEYQKYFQDEAIIVDTNSKYKDLMECWQYPPLEPWIIYKDEILQ